MFGKSQKKKIKAEQPPKSQPPLPSNFELPYKRPAVTYPVKPLKRFKKIPICLTDEKFTQTPIRSPSECSVKKVNIHYLDTPIRSPKEFSVRIPYSDLPSYKASKIPSLEIENFSKIYEKIYPFHLFKTFSKNIEPVTEKPKIFQQISEISIESASNLSDSFITPEESPIVSHSHAPIITDFNLESPLIHNIHTVSIEGWGAKSEISQFSSPQFANFEENVQESNVKSVILFPIHEESIEQPMEISISKEASMSLENLHDFQGISEKNQGFQEKSLVFQEKNLDFQEKNLDFQEKNLSFHELTGKNLEIPEKNLGFPQGNLGFLPANTGFMQETTGNIGNNTNPFLNLGVAEVAKPTYVFGSGKPIESPCNLSGTNPFLMR